MVNLYNFNQREAKRVYNFQNKSIREPVSAETRREILLRAGGKCQSPRCSIREGGYIKLEVHHKDGINSHNKISNLMALCGTHHREIHRKYKMVHKTGLCGERISSRFVKAEQRHKKKSNLPYDFGL